MTTTTEFINEIENICDDLDQQQMKIKDAENCKQVEKLVDTYAEMYDLNCTQALTDCLLTLVRQGDFTTADAIERLNNSNDDYMEDE